MTKLQRLITDLCPSGVPKAKIDNLIAYEQPTRYLVASKSYDDSYSTPVLTAGQTFLLGFTNEEHGKYPASVLRPVIIFDDFTTAHKWVDFEFKVKSSAMKMLTVKPEAPITLRYFWYVLNTIDIDTSEHARYWISKVSDLEIPLPPLEIQEEIVRILDTFVELDAHLKAELEARKVQNSHYRDDLFSLGQRFESEQLRELCVIKTGKKDVNQGNPHGPFPFFTCSRAHTYSDSYSFDTEALLIAGNGEVGLVQYFEGKFEAYQRTYVLTDFRKVQSRYLFQYLKAYLVDHLSTLKQDGTISYIKLAMLADFMIPVPPVEIQNDFIAKFEKFEKLEFELGSELVARKSQYEYYRTKLLTFKEMDVA